LKIAPSDASLYATEEGSSFPSAQPIETSRVPDWIIFPLEVTESVNQAKVVPIKDDKQRQRMRMLATKDLFVEYLVVIIVTSYCFFRQYVL
jgi:hypothetical protein